MELKNTLIVTERLILSPINHCYAAEIFTSFTPIVTKYMFPAPAKEISETHAFIEASMQQLVAETDLVLVILNKDHAFYGCIGLHKLKTATPEIGIWLRETAHGFGYGFEATCGLIAWAREHIKLDYFLYPVDVQNIPSRRIPEKLGGKLIGTKDKQNLSGKTLHLVEYAIY